MIICGLVEYCCIDRCRRSMRQPLIRLVGVFGARMAPRTGILYETAIDLARRHIPEIGTGCAMAAIRECIVDAHLYGMVGMHIPTGMRAGDGFMHLSDIQKLREVGKLPLRCLQYIGLDGLDDALRLGCAAVWVIAGSGSVASRCLPMARLVLKLPRCWAPYESGKGLATMPTDEMFDAIRRSIQEVFRLVMSAVIGDVANRKVLDVFEAALPKRADQVCSPSDEFETQYTIRNAQHRIPNRSNIARSFTRMIFRGFAAGRDCINAADPCNRRYGYCLCCG